MQAVTFNDVRYAVHAALDAAFPDIEIHGEEIKQGLNPPCYFVRLLQPAHTHELGRRYMRYHPVLVRYFPAGGNQEMYGMAEQLTEALRQIVVVGHPVRGTGMRFEIVDGVLHFFVDYNFHIWESRPDDPAMGSLDVREGLK